MSKTATPAPVAQEPSTPASAPAPAVGEAPSPAPAAEEPKKPSILTTAKSLMRSKGDLQTKLSAALTRAETAETALAAAEATIETQTTELTELREVKEVLNGKVTDLAASQQTITAKAVDLVASTGIPAADLPAQASADTETLETLRAKISASSDPSEKATLAAKCRELRFA